MLEKIEKLLEHDLFRCIISGVVGAICVLCVVIGIALFIASFYNGLLFVLGGIVCGILAGACVGVLIYLSDTY